MNPINWGQFLNPFQAALYEGKFEPSSRMMQIGLRERIIDTYQVIRGGTRGTGKGVNWEEFFRIPSGLFDYATLGLFRVAHALYSINHYLFRNAKQSFSKARGFKKGLSGAAVFLSVIPFIITAPINFIGNSLIRPVAAWAVAFPLIISATWLSAGIADWVSLAAGNRLREDISKKPLITGSDTEIFKSLDMRTVYVNHIENKIYFYREEIEIRNKQKIKVAEDISPAQAELTPTQIVQLAKINPHARKMLKDNFFRRYLPATASYEQKDFSRKSRYGR